MLKAATSPFRPIVTEKSKIIDFIFSYITTALKGLYVSRLEASLVSRSNGLAAHNLVDH